MTAVGVGLTALGVNVPLGYLRRGSRKFSGAWFAYVHLSVPLIICLRVRNHITPWDIPGFIACAVAGQFIGGWAAARRSKD